MKKLQDHWAALLALFFALLYLIPLNGRLLWQPDETRYAEISREMLQTGNWINPHLLGLRYFEKPVAGYWFNNISQWIFGENNFAVRFGSVFSTAVTALLVFWLAMMMWRNRSTAFLATLIYLSLLLVFAIGSYSVLDPMISLWLAVAMVAYYLTLRATTVSGKIGAYILLGLACGMGFMTKGFLALAVPVIAVIPIVIQQKRIKELLFYGPIAIVSAVLLSLPWVLAINAAEPDYWHYFFWVEHIQRFAEQDAQHKAPFWYYIPILCLGVLPWAGLLPGSLIKGWKEKKQRPELFFLFSWVVMPIIFFSIAKGKLPTYILPCMAPLALLMAAYVKDCLASQNMRALRINGLINLMFGGLCIITLLVMNSDVHPSSRVFEAQEWPKLWMAVLCFAAWGVFGFIAWRQKAQRWIAVAASPLVLALLVAYVIPSQVMDSKQPQNFIQANLPELKESRYILSDSVGVAAGLAWELKRSNIYMYDQKGEVQYGLTYPDAKSHYVSREDFPAWLVQARKDGNVSLVLLLSRNETLAENNLPEPDKVSQIHRLVLVFYKQQP